MDRGTSQRLSPLQALTGLSVALVVGFQILSALMVSVWWRQAPPEPVETASIPKPAMEVVPGGVDMESVPEELATEGDARPEPVRIEPVAAAPDRPEAVPEPGSGPELEPDAKPEVVAAPESVTPDPRPPPPPQLPEIPTPSLEWITEAERNEERNRKIATTPQPPVVAERTVLAPGPVSPATTPEPSPVEPSPEPLDPGPPPPRDPLTASGLSKDAAKWMRDAVAATAAGDPDEADRLYDLVQQVAPTFHRAYVERASLMERREDFRGARDQWERVVSVSADNEIVRNQALRQVARLDRKIDDIVRLEQAKRDLAASQKLLRETAVSRPSAKPPAAEPAKPPALPKPAARTAATRLRAEPIDPQRMRTPGDAAHDDKYNITVSMLADRSQGPVDLSRVGIRYCFFDRDLRYLDNVYLSNARPIQKLQLHVDRSDPEHDRVILDLPYQIPKGTRDWERNTKDRQLQYYGFLLKVYYDGVPQTDGFPICRPGRVDPSIFTDKHLRAVPPMRKR